MAARDAIFVRMLNVAGDRPGFARRTRSSTLSAFTWTWIFVVHGDGQRPDRSDLGS